MTQNALKTCLASLLALLLNTSTVLAVDFVDSHKHQTEIESQTLRKSDWQLTEKDWNRYNKLMTGKRGVWSPKLDPILALGAHAESAPERRRLAELYVMMEYARVEKELAFQREIDLAWKRLFPDTPRVISPLNTDDPTLSSGDVQ